MSRSWERYGLGGRLLSRIPLEQIRRQVAVAAQRSALFSGTVRDNLSMGDRSAGEDQLYAALEAAQAADFVKDAGGLSARLDQGGANLSGGQRQRLSLARALLRESAVLILDDCTSALDPGTEHKVLARHREEPQPGGAPLTQKIRAASGWIGFWYWRKVGRQGWEPEFLMDSCPAYRELWTSQALR